MDDNTERRQWLLEHGGPAIRYRTATELRHGPSDVSIGQLSADLLNSEMTREWLERVAQPGSSLSSFHHSRPEAFENAASKLCDLGLRAGMAALDERMQPYRRWLETQAQAISEISEVDYTEVDSRDDTQTAVDQGIRWFEAVLVAARLAWMGYRDPAISLCLHRRLETLYRLARTGNHDIYIDQDTFGDYPNNPFRKRQFVDPRFNGLLPNIHDLYALAHYPPDLRNEEARSKINTVIAYILHPDYQALEEGYGVMRAGPRRYFAIGWSIHLPGYDNFEFDTGQAGSFIQRLALMAHFPPATRHPWFQKSLTYLEGFRQEDGTYRLPPSYLKESSGGYWVSGAYMRLEENRRRRVALTLDSTFRMCKIKQLVESHNGPNPSD